MQRYTVYLYLETVLHVSWWYFHPSSGAHTTVSTASGICHTVTAICRYRGRVGTGLSVLWVAYTTPQHTQTASCAAVNQYRHQRGTRSPKQCISTIPFTLSSCLVTVAWRYIDVRRRQLLSNWFATLRINSRCKHIRPVHLHRSVIIVRGFSTVGCTCQELTGNAEFADGDI